jgi:hypothetical protein
VSAAEIPVPEFAMSQYELAQLNVARMKAPLDSPVMADFVANLERINRLAEASPGFVWRLQSDEGDATAFRPMGDDLLVNMSVWRDVATLRDFAYRSAHAEILRRRREWFERMTDAYTVLWWVAKGHRPTLTEAEARLDYLRRYGPSAFAFGLRDAFAPPDAAVAAQPATARDRCPAG